MVAGSPVPRSSRLMPTGPWFGAGERLVRCRWRGLEAEPPLRASAGAGLGLDVPPLRHTSGTKIRWVIFTGAVLCRALLPLLLAVLALNGSIAEAQPDRVALPRRAGSCAADARAGARAAIETSCPCTAATSARTHFDCARGVLTARLATGAIAAGCLREALSEVRLSTCGRPGAAVCCRVHSNGATRHRIVASAGDCRGTSTYSACVSTGWTSTATGCDAEGCVAVPSECGNSSIEGTEQCDPPNDISCDATCRFIIPPDCGNWNLDEGEQCDPPNGTTCDATCRLIIPPNCGNSTLDAGEQCDPPDSSTCDATCRFIVPPNCGNWVLDEGEQCDPPDGSTCDAICQSIPCATPTTACGNGTVDPGESCDPPGVGTCGRDCLAAPCAPPAADEFAITCIPDATGTSFDAASNGSNYLVAWSAPLARMAHSDVLVRRFDPDAVALDAGPIDLTADAACGRSLGGPAVGSDGSNYYVGFTGGGSLGSSGGWFNLIGGRRVGGDGSIGETTEQFVFEVPFGTCRSATGGPLAASGAGAARFALTWEQVGGCMGNIMFRNPGGTIADFDPLPLTQSGFSLGYPINSPPGFFAASRADVDTLGPDTLAVWMAVAVAESAPPYVPQPFLAGAWLDGGTATRVSLGALVHGSVERAPALAPGAESFLVAWAANVSSTVTTIRALRFNRVDGRLDAEGGVLIATTASGPITDGPVSAFDGSHWQVGWIERLASGAHELRAVAVRADGSVVEATPRLLASAVGERGLTLASAGDGRSLAVYLRPEAGRSGVVARLFE